MQITSGGFRGKKLYYHESLHIRPTSDKVRSAIFDVIRLKIKGSRFLDLFAGTGAVGIQALSEGASFTYFVEENWKCASVIKKNLNELNLFDKAKVIKKKVEKFLKEEKDTFKNFDLIFLDPPYDYTDKEYDFLIQELLSYTKRDVIVIIEHSSKRLGINYFLKYKFANYKFKKYGDTALTILYKEVDKNEKN